MVAAELAELDSLKGVTDLQRRQQLLLATSVVINNAHQSSIEEGDSVDDEELGDDGLDFDLAKRVREAIVGSDAKGVPALNLTPAQVEQLSAEHDDVQSMVEALEGKTHHAAALAGGADEKGVAPPLEDGMIAPTKGASATVTFEEHSWRH